MKTKGKSNSKELDGKDTGTNKKAFLQGYPASPSGEDIYDKFFEEKEINPENTSENKGSDRKHKTVTNKGKEYNKSVSTDDLDVPGSELDDMQEGIGSEDEENNYYSLGGDKKSDLEEDQAE